MEKKYKGITCCGDCVYYNTKKHYCTRGAKDEGKAQDHFYADCPLEDVAPVSTKYAWHDLRKNPKDLPDAEKIVEIAFKSYCGNHYLQIHAFYEDGNVHSENSDYGFDELEDWCEYCEDTDDYVIPEGWMESARFAECFGVIDRAVVAWREIEPFENGIEGSCLSKCSECGFSTGTWSFKYCPNCGAKMDGSVEN